MSGRPIGQKFVSGNADSGRLILFREDGSIAINSVVIVRGTLVDNGDSTFDFVFDGS